MKAQGDLETLSAGIKAGVGGRVRLLTAGGLLLTALLLYLLLLLFPGLEDRSLHPLRALDQIEGDGLLLWYCVGAAAILWWVWSVLGGALQRTTMLRAAGLPAEGSVRHALDRWASHFAPPLLLLFATALLLAMTYGIVQVVRIPYGGWPLLLVLSPLVLLLAGSAVRLVLRWLHSGYLTGPAVAEGNADAFRALSRAFAFGRRAPWQGIRMRALGCVALIRQGIGRVVPTAGAVAVVWLLLCRLPGGAACRVERVLTTGLCGCGAEADVAAVAILLLLTLLGAWILAVPVAMFFGARTAVYLALRRDLDGVPVDDAGERLNPEKTLAELGFELVRRLRPESEEE